MCEAMNQSNETAELLYNLLLILVSLGGWAFALYKERTMHKINNKARTYEHLIRVVYLLERVAATGRLTRDDYEAKNAEILSIDLYGSDEVITDLNNILDTVININNHSKTELPIAPLETLFFEELNILSKSMRKDLGYKKMKNDPTTLSDIDFIE